MSNNPLRTQAQMGTRVGYGKINLRAQAKRDRKRSGGNVPPVQPPLKPKAKK